jgi:hypothetical protein
MPVIVILRTGVAMKVDMLNAVVSVLMDMDVLSAKSITQNPDADPDEQQTDRGLGSGFDSRRNDKTKRHGKKTKKKQCRCVTQPPEEPEPCSMFWARVFAGEGRDGSDVVNIKRVDAPKC